MRKNKQELIFGIEVKKNFINISCIEISNCGPCISFMRSVAISPKTKEAGEVFDTHFLAESISNVLIDFNYENAKVVIGIYDLDFYKSIDKFSSKISKQDVLAKIGRKMHHISKHKEQKYKPAFHLGSEEKKDNRLVFYGAIQELYANKIAELADLLSFRLADIEIVPLAILRSIIWNNSHLSDNFLSMVIEDDYIDMNVVFNNQILLTRTIRLDLSKIIDNEYLFNSVFQKLEMFVLSFTDNYPRLEFPKKAVLFSRMENNEKILGIFSEKLSSEYDCEILKEPPFGSDRTDKGEILSSHDLTEGCAALGMALKPI
ncbi:hypothetical protein ACFLZV_06930, partial [Candidatus Margulisiibacteriota bacterium]